MNPKELEEEKMLKSVQFLVVKRKGRDKEPVTLCDRLPASFCLDCGDSITRLPWTKNSLPGEGPYPCTLIELPEARDEACLLREARDKAYLLRSLL